MVMTRNLAKNKQKTTCHAKERGVNVQQKGSTRWIYNGMELINQIKLNCQATVRAPAKPRYPKNISQRGAFNGVVSIFVGTLFSPAFQK